MSIAHGMFSKEGWREVERFADWREQMMREDREFVNIPYDEQLRMWQREQEGTDNGTTIPPGSKIDSGL